MTESKSEASNVIKFRGILCGLIVNLCVKSSLAIIDDDDDHDEGELVDLG